MATVEEVLAAAGRAEAAGDAAAATRLRAHAETLKPATKAYDPEKLKAAADRAKTAGDDAAAARLLAAIPAPASNVPSDYQIGIDGPAPPPVGGGRTSAEIMEGAQRTAPQPQEFGDAAKAMMAGPIAGMQAFGGGLTGGPSPSRDFLAQDPLTQGLPGPVLTGLGVVGDAGGAALSTIGAGLSGLVGLGVEAVPTSDKQGLGEELLGMAQFAVPELAGMSSIPARAAQVGAKVAPVTKAVAETPEAVAALVRKASKPGMGSVKAQEKLAEAARLNPEAKAAADRLGIDLPADVFSDNEMVKASAGLTRSEVGKEPEAMWRGAIKAARDRADEVMGAMDGSPDIASVSDAVKSSLQATQAGLKTAAKSLYDMVDAKVPKSSRVPVENIVKALNGVIEDIGGVNGMSSAERGLYNLVTGSEPVTYGRLLREKSDIGRAIARGDGPYGNMDQATLKRMYGAISEDQLGAVEALGDADLRAQLREANQLTAKQKGLEKRIVTAYGSDLDGSIGSKLRLSITQGAKGDIAGLTKLLKVIPDDLRKQAVASAISAATRSARATEPGFGLAEFAKTFGGIKNNKPVYLQISKAIGSEATQMLDDLLTVSRRIASADSNVLRTGKANQVLAQAMQADGLVGRVLHSTGGQRIVQAAAGATGATMGGPMGAMVAAPIAVALTAARPETLALAGKLFASERFMRMAVEAAEKGQASAASIDRLAKSGIFKAWARSARVKDPMAVLRGAVAPLAAQEAANANRNPEQRGIQ